MKWLVRKEHLEVLIDLRSWSLFLHIDRSSEYLWIIDILCFSIIIP
jgi:hypothetical protein